jgi:hypothetical protein
LATGIATLRATVPEYTSNPNSTTHASRYVLIFLSSGFQKQ